MGEFVAQLLDVLASAGAGLLLIAGAQKMRRGLAPSSVRIGWPLNVRRRVGRTIGAVELLAACWWLFQPGPSSGSLLVAVFVALTAAAAGMRLRDGAAASCACFGTTVRLSWLHVGGNALLLAAVGLSVAFRPLQTWRSEPLPVELLYSAGIACAAWMSYVLFAEAAQLRSLFRPRDGGVS